MWCCASAERQRRRVSRGRPARSRRWSLGADGQCCGTQALWYCMAAVWAALHGCLCCWLACDARQLSIAACASNLHLACSMASQQLQQHSPLALEVSACAWAPGSGHAARVAVADLQCGPTPRDWQAAQKPSACYHGASDASLKLLAPPAAVQSRCAGWTRPSAVACEPAWFEPALM